jgi:uncharacterized repeat protein (TIGR03803 family)
MRLRINWALQAVIAVAALMPPHGAAAAEFAVIYSFAPPNGVEPQASLTYDRKHRVFYGTAHDTVFKVTPAGVETTLYKFKEGKDGSDLLSGVVFDADGNIFGATTLGGTMKGSCVGLGCGTVFKIAPDGTHTVLHTFKGDDGSWPMGTLMMDGRGDLYGTTFEGGQGGYGAIFRVTPDGTETTIHSFDGTDGQSSEAGLLQANGGKLYGTTEFGGGDRQGTLFDVTKAGSESVLHAFTLGGDGGDPVSPLIADAEGNFYGTTADGGTDVNGGTVFMFSPDGTETVLHNFTGGDGDGARPLSAVYRDAQGHLYGTTFQGGPANLGIVYEIAPDGTETVLHSFAGGTSDGASPYAALVADEKGRLYGTTFMGGADNAGVIFRITP